jgi:galactose mutarotase-like enzyme
MVVLENDELKVSLSSKGAELMSMIDKKDQTEYIWQGNPDYWAYHAPHLFPVVGGLNHDNLLVDGNQFPLSRHGFARTSTFRRIESAPQQAIFELRYNQETLAAYPYKFEFQVIYFLVNRSLKVVYKVINLDNKDIYFSVGAHPGFNVPFNNQTNFEDYYIDFQTNEDLESHQLTANGLFNNEKITVLTDDNKLALSYDLFEKDALVFKNIQFRSVTLKSKKSTKQVKVDFPNFNYLGLWSKRKAPFICIEPWLGCADTDGYHLDISKKEAIQQLKHGHVFETDFTITV